MRPLSPLAKVFFVVLGTMFGGAMTLGVVALVFLNKPSFILPKKNPSGPVVTIRPDTKITLMIRPNKTLKKISPFIYGSCLTAKTEYEMDVAGFAKDTGLTIFRFPGGGDDGYRWETGEFDFSDRVDKAPLSKMDNIIKFCSLAEADLLIQVNLESGTPEEAARWVSAMNIDKKMRVDYWELGNEVYGDWSRNYMTGGEYAKVVRDYSQAMKAIDPTIKIGADYGGPNYPLFNEELIKGAASDIDFLSFHWYPSHTGPSHWDGDSPHPKPEDVMANSLNVGRIVKGMDRLIERYAPERKGKIELCFLEWDGSWDAVPSDPSSSAEGIMWSLANGIFFADTLGQFALHGVTVATQFDFQEIMFGLIRGWDQNAGWGGSRWDGVTIRPKALAMKLFARYFGNVLVESQLSGSPFYVKNADWQADSYTGEVPYVSAYVSRFEGMNKLAIVLINKHADRDFDVVMLFDGVELEPEGKVWVLNGPSLEAQNDGAPGTVDIKERKIRGFEKQSTYKVPAHSVSLLQVDYHG